MRRSVSIPLLCAALLAWSGAAGAMGREEARHLLVRTGFEATPAAVARLQPLRYEHAVAWLLKETRTEAVTPPPAWIHGDAALSPDTADAAAARDLKGWWVREMRDTPSPLTERMTLFWHNHFVSELREVRSPRLMYRQNVLLRRHGLGSFRALLHEIARDPAMAVYLSPPRGGARDARFARVLLERFTLGEGAYRAKDLKEAERAFAGWRADPPDGPREGGAKAARSGKAPDKAWLARKQVIDAILRDPRTAEFIVEKLWREFVSDKLDAKEVRRLAADFRRTYQLKPLMRGLLLTRAFRASSQRGRMIKSPVELLIGAARQFRVPVGDGRELAQVTAMLGQDLFDPPGEAGWRGGTAWISATLLPARQQAVDRLLRAREEGEADAAAGLDGMNATHLRSLLLPVPPLDPVPTGLSTFDLALHLAHDPAYQLK